MTTESLDIVALETFLPDRSTALLDQARAIRAITDEVTYCTAAELLVEVKGVIKDIGEKAEEALVPLRATHKAVLRLRDESVDPFAVVEASLKSLMVGYEIEQERQRQELEAKLREEQARLEEEERLREAVALEAAGDMAAAERVLDAPSFEPAVVVPSATPRVAGVSYVTRYKADPVGTSDEVNMALARAVVDGKIPPIAIQPNMVFINAQARSLRGAFAIPGFRIVIVKDVAASSRR